MSDGKEFFSIPYIVPALIADTVGILAGVALIVTGNMAFGIGAIVLGSVPLLLVMLNHAKTKGGRS